MSFDPEIQYARCAKCKEALPTHIAHDDDDDAVLEIEPCKNCCVEE